VEEALAAAAPRPVRFVDGKEGIARRTAWLTRHLGWPGDAVEGVALFTGRDTDVEAYRLGLARYGLTRLERL
ncbi:MAG TPA: glutamate racemase, partial [Allosphingosinicella sp.]